MHTIKFSVGICCPLAIDINGAIEAQGGIEAEVHIDVIALRVVIVIIRVADDESSREVLVVEVILTHLVGVKRCRVTIALGIHADVFNVQGGVLRREGFKLAEFIARVEDEFSAMLPLHLVER